MVKEPPDKKPRTEVRGHRVVGRSRVLYGTLGGVHPRSPPASAGSLDAFIQALSASEGIRDGSHRYPAVSLWKRAGLMPNTRLNAREN